MGKTAGRARFARFGIAVAVLVVLAGIGVALAATVGGLAPAGGSNALMVEEPTTRPQDTLEAEPEALAVSADLKISSTCSAEHLGALEAAAEADATMAQEKAVICRRLLRSRSRRRLLVRKKRFASISM